LGASLNSILWRRAFTLPSDFVVPPETDLRMVVDPAFTAKERDRGQGENASDETSIAVGFLEDSDALNLLDVIHGRFKGIGLPNAIVTAIELWKPVKVSVEPNPFVDLLIDTIQLRAEMRSVEIPPITLLPRRQIKGAKPRRIRRIETDLLECDPPLLKIRRGAFVSALMNEVELFDGDSPTNHRRPDSMLDSIGLLAGF
jgi:hypothetical protein